ncbi:hypothetical protein [Streptomyces sp. NPDC047070]|uniref:hypothetical protein n=1 Tax=Streptomyces sp. NPDC047070 TaxID=3154923 RepID=UPI003455E920
MSSCSIVRCGRPLLAHEHRRRVCDRCANRVRGWLRELDLQRILLRVMLVPGSSGPATGSVHGGRAHSPMPARGDVLNFLGPGASSTLADPYGDARGDQDAGATIDATLHAWARATAEHIHPPDRPWLRPGRTWSAWLTAYLPWALSAPWIGDLHDELDDLVQQARGLTRTEPRRRPKDAPCPSCQAFGLVEEDWQPYIECTVCEALLTPDEYARHAQDVMPRLYRTALLIAARTEKQRRKEQAEST